MVSPVSKLLDYRAPSSQALEKRSCAEERVDSIRRHPARYADHFCHRIFALEHRGTRDQHSRRELVRCRHRVDDRQQGRRNDGRVRCQGLDLSDHAIDRELLKQLPVADRLRHCWRDIDRRAIDRSRVISPDQTAADVQNSSIIIDERVTGIRYQSDDSPERCGSRSARRRQSQQRSTFATPTSSRIR